MHSIQIAVPTVDAGRWLLMHGWCSLPARFWRDDPQGREHGGAVPLHPALGNLALKEATAQGALQRLPHTLVAIVGEQDVFRIILRCCRMISDHGCAIWSPRGPRA